jgi:hypothetical protein
MPFGSPFRLTFSVPALNILRRHCPPTDGPSKEVVCNGKADILWHHATLGEVWVWLMDGAVSRSETWVGTVSDVGYRPVTVK